MEGFNDTINLGEDVVKVLKGIFDPEIPVDITNYRDWETHE